MGNGMNKVLPGLYVGNYRDSKDHQQLNRFSITHILAIHDSPRRLLPDKHYLCVMAADTPDQNLSQYFPVCNDFVHGARLRDGNVLIHCLAGMSRSVTVAVAYIMTVTNLNWKEALKVVRAGRAVANPNLGFQTQLQEFEMFKICDERRRLKERFPSLALESLDRDQCFKALNSYEELLLNKDICEGNCTRGEKCPTGVCNMDTTKGIFRRRPSNASGRARLAPPSSSQSCPTSPKYTQRRNTRASSECEKTIEDGDMMLVQASARTTCSNGLTRSASTMSSSACRPRSSPAGLYSYTGSAPTSVHGSRVDLTATAPTTSSALGSAIYLGCTPPRSNIITGSSVVSSTSRQATSGSSAPPSPNSTPPPISPRHAIRRTTSVTTKKRLVDRKNC